MTRPPITNMVASVRRRLLNHAKAHNDDYQRILTRYAIERLLYRLSQTEAQDTYVLKGAMLFVTWPDHAFRPTGDLDLLGHGDHEPPAIAALFTRICRVEAPDDGLTFDTESLRVEVMREKEQYQGTRLTLLAYLGTTKIHVQVDLGFGDRVYPTPSRQIFPCLLPDLPAAEIFMYPPETVLAEKFEAMIRFADETTRIKDFHDIWVTTRTFKFDLATLAEAVGGTLARRRTPTPTNMPSALSAAFAQRPDKQDLWTGFLRRNPPSQSPPDLEDLLGQLRSFFGPVLTALALPEAADGRWNPDRRAWE
jgi:hypothetical protein